MNCAPTLKTAAGRPLGTPRCRLPSVFPPVYGDRTLADHGMNLRCLAVRKLEITRNNTGNSNVFVKIFPTERITVQPQRYLLQLVICRLGQKVETISRKTNDPAIREFNENRSPFDPNPDCCRLGGTLFMCDGTHDISPTAIPGCQIRAFQSPAPSRVQHLCFSPAVSTRARTCIHLRESPHECEGARPPHQNKSEIERLQPVKSSALYGFKLHSTQQL